MVKNKSTLRNKARLISKAEIKRQQDNHNPYMNFPAGQKFIEHYNNAISEGVQLLILKNNGNR